ncbi:unnamed protein product [Protopolystoma xenopodis]|uniref:Uncharacterized protein n=1 Tax=Protopolystoma xenopodis TaxID=117903 RepID=A0A3S5CJ06_9PLAT|nr:unnamed protein product [Protopolystoma xenopodis]
MPHPKHSTHILAQQQMLQQQLPPGQSQPLPSQQTTFLPASRGVHAPHSQLSQVAPSGQAQSSVPQSLSHLHSHNQQQQQQTPPSAPASIGLGMGRTGMPPQRGHMAAPPCGMGVSGGANGFIGQPVGPTGQSQGSSNTSVTGAMQPNADTCGVMPSETISSFGSGPGTIGLSMQSQQQLSTVTAQQQPPSVHQRYMLSNQSPQSCQMPQQQQRQQAHMTPGLGTSSVGSASTYLPGQPGQQSSQQQQQQQHQLHHPHLQHQAHHSGQTPPPPQLQQQHRHPSPAQQQHSQQPQFVHRGMVGHSGYASIPQYPTGPVPTGYAQVPTMHPQQQQQQQQHQPQRLGHPNQFPHRFSTGSQGYPPNQSQPSQYGMPVKPGIPGHIDGQTVGMAGSGVLATGPGGPCLSGSSQQPPSAGMSTSLTSTPGYLSAGQTLGGVGVGSAVPGQQIVGEPGLLVYSHGSSTASGVCVNLPTGMGMSGNSGGPVRGQFMQVSAAFDSTIDKGTTHMRQKLYLQDATTSTRRSALIKPIHIVFVYIFIHAYIHLPSCFLVFMCRKVSSVLSVRIDLISKISNKSLARESALCNQDLYIIVYM